MECPNCHLENPPEALRCDCGYDFPSGTVMTPYLTPEDARQMAPFRRPREGPRWLLWLGVALLACGVISMLLERAIKSPRSVTFGFVFCAVIVKACWFFGPRVSRWR
jgi:hypothetical protein